MARVHYKPCCHAAGKRVLRQRQPSIPRKNFEVSESHKCPLTQGREQTPAYSTAGARFTVEAPCWVHFRKHGKPRGVNSSVFRTFIVHLHILTRRKHWTTIVRHISYREQVWSNVEWEWQPSHFDPLLYIQVG